MTTGTPCLMLQDEAQRAIDLYTATGSKARAARKRHPAPTGGGVPMPVGAYDFSRGFGWLNDGVSWPLSRLY
ncbi:hypothetical protein [Ottowia sp. SB7-C50]|uniref:hypothetical protein n=1 Tax=Ottowia sp. SB7-C50 TaxID=3081231 RepID=UPI002952E972|nr:hypothetical protein [Ottowia sp. SB7-C50]WOP16744.1 hypothetical protein R0D99_07035 [Ottowia sp. SB7-C50]